MFSVLPACETGKGFSSHFHRISGNVFSQREETLFYDLQVFYRKDQKRKQEILEIFSEFLSRCVIE